MQRCFSDCLLSSLDTLPDSWRSSVENFLISLQGGLEAGSLRFFRGGISIGTLVGGVATALLSRAWPQVQLQCFDCRTLLAPQVASLALAQPLLAHREFLGRSL